MTVLKAACIQVNSGPEIAGNLDMVEPLIHVAAGRGAQFIALPENVAVMIKGRDKVIARARPEAEHPGIPFFKRMAKETGTWIVGGTLAIRLGSDKLANRCYLFSPQGEVAATYDKIHMFDANIGEGETYRESETFQSGTRAVVADTALGKIGLTVCYDMRFAYLYRALAKAGAAIITVPSAFTVPTGRMHWQVLLRARAIETGAFVIAPAQCGTHESGRQTYGHSLIVDPMGQVLAEAGDIPEIIMADLDLAKVGEAHRMLPSLQHDRDFSVTC
ncbi:MAG: carbon-nitrogen hydrolase family protein [Bdellovibrionales bacterium]